MKGGGRGRGGKEEMEEKGQDREEEDEREGSHPVIASTVMTAGCEAPGIRREKWI